MKKWECCIKQLSDDCCLAKIDFHGSLKEFCISHVPGNGTLLKDFEENRRRPATVLELERATKFYNRKKG